MIIRFILELGGKLTPVTWKDGLFTADDEVKYLLADIFRMWEGTLVSFPTFPPSQYNHVRNWAAVTYIMNQILPVVSISGIPETDNDVVY